MSRARTVRIGDTERTSILLDLVHRRYRGDYREQDHLPPRWVLVEEVKPSTGWSGAHRFADVLALNMWPSDGLELDGYEIKASKPDLMRELADPNKHAAVARYCNTWTLVAWDALTLPDLTLIPSAWGIEVTEPVGEHGDRKLVTVRTAPKREPEPWPRGFVCSLVRNAYQQSPGARYVARAAVAACVEGRKSGENVANGDWSHALRPIVKAIYGDRWHGHEPGIDDREEFVQAVVDRLSQGIFPAGA